MTSDDQPDRDELTTAGRRAGPTGEDRADRRLLWNGFEELTARLDTTEDAVAAALDTLTTDVDDLKTQLAQLLEKEQEKDVTAAAVGRPRHPQGLGQPDRLGRPAQRRLLTARRLHHPAVLARAPRRRRRTRRPPPVLDPRHDHRRTRQEQRRQRPHRLARPVALALPPPHEGRALPHHQLPRPPPDRTATPRYPPTAGSSPCRVRTRQVRAER